MNPEEIQKLQKRARFVAVKWGYADLADDIAQEVILSLMRWPGQKVEQAVIGFLRKEHGDPGTHCGRIRKAQRFRAVRLDAPVDTEDSDSTLHHELVGGTERDPEPERSAGGVPSNLTPAQELVYELRYVEEWTWRQIAEHLERSVPWVGLQLSMINKKLRGSGALEELETKLIEDPKFLQLEVDWIKW